MQVIYTLNLNARCVMLLPQFEEIYQIPLMFENYKNSIRICSTKLFLDLSKCCSVLLFKIKLKSQSTHNSKYASLVHMHHGKTNFYR